MTTTSTTEEKKEEGSSAANDEATTETVGFEDEGGASKKSKANGIKSNPADNAQSAGDEGVDLHDLPEEEVKAGVSASRDAGGDDDAEKPAEDDIPLSFPQKLMGILSKKEYSDIICWLPHGKGFMILDRARFADDVLPKHFKQSKFTSFTRKLNRWNFTRVTRGPEVGSYYHPLFQKGNAKLTAQMTCIKSKVPQQMQPLDPVALGVDYYYGGTTSVPADPAQITKWHQQEHQRQLFYQQYMQQQQQFFMAAQVQAGATGQAPEHSSGANREMITTANGESSAPTTGTTDMKQMAAMQAFQHQQYFAAMMAHQQAAVGAPAPTSTQGSEEKGSAENDDGGDEPQPAILEEEPTAPEASVQTAAI